MLFRSDLCAGAVPAVKPQAAFFEVLGADGVAAFERVVAAAKSAGLLVIGDVKRGDIGSTAAAYAEACLSGAERGHMCDAATVNPYLGSDSITPFVDACRAADAGIYVLVRTSNPGGADLQALELAEGGSVAEHMARAVAGWGAELVGRADGARWAPSSAPPTRPSSSGAGALGKPSCSWAPEVGVPAPPKRSISTMCLFSLGKPRMKPSKEPSSSWHSFSEAS